MIKINLLPQAKIKKAEHPEIIALVQVLFFALILIFAVIYLLKTMTLADVNRELSLNKQELTKYQALVNELNAIKSLMAQLEAKKDLIKNLMNRRVIYPVFMEELLAHLPRTMWLNSLNTSISEDGTISFDIDATALDIYTIADLVRITETSDVIRNAELGAISQTGSEPSVMYNFSMKATFKK